MRDLRSAADETVVIAPARRTQSFAAVSLPDEELRATASVPTSTLERERQNARCHVAEHGATEAFRFDDALIVDGCWYANGVFDRLKPLKRRMVVVDRAELFEEAQLCTDIGAEIFFGHWLVDALCMELLAEDRGLHGLSLAGSNRIHEPSYRELLALPGCAVSTARVRRLWVVDDRGYNAHRVRRFHRLRERLRSAVTPSTRRLVYIDRGNSGAARTLLNRDAIVDELVKRGFTVLAPEQESARTIAETLAGARLAVGLEGSHLNHALLALPEGAGLLAIQPASHFNMFNKTMSEFAGVRFGFVVADQRPGGFHVDGDRLLDTIELLDRATTPDKPATAAHTWGEIPT
jgi:capsular polysaccharide biosynthesis protein